MAKTPKYILGGREFFTKKEAVDYAKRIKECLISQISDDNITPSITDEYEEFAFLADLVSHHPDAPEKIGTGIQGFSVKTNLLGNGYELCVVQTVTASLSNFSLDKCLKKYTPYNALFEACRMAVNSQKVAFKTKTFEENETVNCPVTHTTITPGTCIVHHKPPNTFNILVLRWMAENGWTVDSVMIGGTGPDDAQKYLEDDAQEQSWKDFHSANAELQVLSVPGHHAEHSRKGSNAD